MKNFLWANQLIQTILFSLQRTNRGLKQERTKFAEYVNYY